MSGSTVSGARPRALFTDEHAVYRESVRTHLERAVVPHAEEWDHAARTPVDAIRAAAEHGFTGAQIPEAHGGLGVDDVRFAAVIVEEAMRAGLPAFALVLAAHDDVPVRALRDSRPGAHHAAWLTALASAEIVATSALHGDVTGRADGEDLVLDGAAFALVNGEAAGLLIVSVATDTGPELVVLVPGMPGVSIAASEPPIGLRAAGLTDLKLNAARVPAGHRLTGSDGETAALLTDLLTGERLLLAAASVAGARAALDLTVDYVRDRRAFGQPIGSFQNSRQMLGEVATRLAAAEALVDVAIQERVDGRLTAARAAAAKLHATATHDLAVDTGVQLHGGYGYMLEYPIATAFADTRFLRLCGGTSQDLRDEVAADLDL